ncbi:MAG: hypothetical protein KAS17_00695 [Victivallaceae bacterium]|nr:hypothetical protein [Victivallaceae bacterium]
MIFSQLSSAMSVLTGVDSSRQLKQNVELFNKGSLPGDLLDKVRKIVPTFPETVIRPVYWPK